MFEGNFLERIAPARSRRPSPENRDGMRVLFQHGRDPQVGDKPLGPIESLNADAEYEVPLLDTSYNRDLLPGLKAGLYGAPASGSGREGGAGSRTRRVGPQPEGAAGADDHRGARHGVRPRHVPRLRGRDRRGAEPHRRVPRAPFAAHDARTRPPIWKPEPVVEATPEPVKDDEPEHSPEASRATPEPDKPQTNVRAQGERR
jgi:hypothetical protein